MASEMLTDAPSFVYVIGPKDYGAVKIGLADDVQARLPGIQTGHPRELFVLLSAEYGGRARAVNMERKLHRYFATSRVRGEWFDVTVEEVRDVLLDYGGARIFDGEREKYVAPIEPRDDIEAWVADAHPLAGMTLSRIRRKRG